MASRKSAKTAKTVAPILTEDQQIARSIVCQARDNWECYGEDTYAGGYDHALTDAIENELQNRGIKGGSDRALAIGDLACYYTVHNAFPVAY